MGNSNANKLGDVLSALGDVLPALGDALAELDDALTALDDALAALDDVFPAPPCQNEVGADKVRCATTDSSYRVSEYNTGWFSQPVSEEEQRQQEPKNAVQLFIPGYQEHYTQDDRTRRAK